MAHGPGREHPDQLGHVESEEVHQGEGRGVAEDHDVDLGKYIQHFDIYNIRPFSKWKPLILMP